MNEPTTKAQEISDLVRRLCVALSNVEAFSPDHALAKKHVAAAYQCLSGLLHRQNRPLIISAAEKRFMFERMPLEDRNPLVEKLATRLEEIGANHLVFDPELTEAEFLGFYRVLSRGTRHINEHGGLPPMLAEAQVTHIQARRIDFVMVDEDQKVVSKSATMVDPAGATPPAAETNLMEYVLQKVLARADEQQWLMQEMKNHPQRVADLFVEGINLAASRAEMGMTDASAGLEALVKNIQVLGTALATEADGAATPDQAQLEKSIAVMENEIRQRSSQLTSSKVAAGLLTEILGVIASYTDRSRARKLASEFLQGEKSLEKAELLLRSLAPPAESVENFLGRIRTQLLGRGVSAEELARLEAVLAKKSRPRPKPSAKPRKRFSDAVSQGITKRLQELNVEGPQLAKVIDSLGSFVEDRAREKAGELHLRVDRLDRQVTRRDNALLQVPVGVVIWDGTGAVELVNTAAEKILGFEGGVPLSGGLAARLRDGSYPLTDHGAALPQDLPANEAQLLRSVSLVLKGDNGEIYGAVLAAPNGH